MPINPSPQDLAAVEVSCLCKLSPENFQKMWEPQMIETAWQISYNPPPPAKILRKQFAKNICMDFFWKRRNRGENWTHFFSQSFGQFRDIPAKSRDIPPKKVWFPWFWGAYWTFWPPLLHVEDPYPTGEYPDSKVWVCALFSCLKQGSNPHTFGLSKKMVRFTKGRFVPTKDLRRAILRWDRQGRAL